MTAVKALNEIDRKDIKHVGGKSASLGEMLKNGLPVPDGFIVTTDIFKLGMTKKFEKEILNAFEDLKVQRVAVRSSAIAEDSADASWAGQLESYLNVHKQELIKTIKKCWESIESTRAKEYANRHMVKKSERAVAVLVQTMIDSEISGVMFTANPITGNRNEKMIEAVYGLGEMIVQGIVTPESIVTDETGNELSRSVHRQSKQLIYKNAKNTEVPVDSRLQNKHILSSRQIKELIELSRKIEQHFSSPQDIEWTYADGKFYLLQSRPITTLLRQRTTPPTGNGGFFLKETNEVFRWGPIRGRFFYISDFVSAAIKELPLSYSNERFPEGLLLFNNEQMVWLSDMEQFVENGKRVFKKFIENPEILAAMKQEWEQAVSEMVQFQINIIPMTLRAMSDKEFVNTWQAFYKKLMKFWVPSLLPELGNYGAPDLLKQSLKQYIPDEEELIAAQEILTAPEELSFYQQEEFKLVETTDIAAHHAKYFWLKNSYGHVEVLNQNFFKDRQKKLITMPKPLSQSELQQKVQTAKLNLQEQYNISMPVIRRAKLISENIIWQDKRKRIMSENFHYKKILLEELARRADISFDELLDFGFDEASDLLNNKNNMKSNRCYGVHFNTEINRLSEDSAKKYWHEFARYKKQNTGIIKGIVVSTGQKPIIKARVRVLHSSHDILKPGEVLVTAMTSPGYVFAMRHAAAVITDIGGLTSHAAILAREIGVPCIVGTKIATQLLHTGDKVHIDTLHGIIKFIKEK